MTIPILYEDNHLLIVEKPPNMPVQGDVSGDMDLLNYFKAFLVHRDNKPGDAYLGLVHRLDRPVGGALAFAKTSKAASRLGEQFRRQSPKRHYLAWVQGTRLPASGDLEHYLYKDRRQNQTFVVDAKHPKGKRAYLRYANLYQNGSHSLLALSLHTGRPHQIRVQLQASGCPIVGDQKYGFNPHEKSTRQLALWSYELEILHPTKKTPLLSQAPLPKKEPWTKIPSQALEHIPWHKLDPKA